MQAVTLEPDHFDALNGFGKLLAETGYTSAAITVLTRAILSRPDHPIAHANLGNAFYLRSDLVAARQCYERSLELDSNRIESHRGLSYVLRDLGAEEAAERHRALGFRSTPVTSLPYRGESEPIRVLQVVSAAGGNLPIERCLDDRIFFTTVVVAEYFDCNRTLPAHSLAINGIADADLCKDALVAAEKILAKSQAPIVNSPAAVAGTSRVASASRLGRIPDVIAPRTASVPRAVLESKRAEEVLVGFGFRFPLLLRSPGFHTGQYFVKLEGPDQLSKALETLPGRDLTAIEFLDGRGKDGNFRKYRVMMIDGQLFPLHLAISREWMIHYFSADMADRAEHRAEEKQFLESMPRALGEKAMVALDAIRKTLGLDYAGIDFGLNAEGELLLFEANAAMNVVMPNGDPRWDYRRPHLQAPIDATRRMFIAKAGMVR